MGAEYAETIVFRFIGYNLLGSAVRDASGMLYGLARAGTTSTSQLATDLTSAGAIAATWGAGLMLAGVVAAGGIAYAASRAAEFNSQMILLHTQARVATSDLQPLGAGILVLAGQTGFMATEMAKAMYQIESVGGGSYTVAHALDILKAAAMGAAVGHSDLTLTASVLASTMATFPSMLPIQAMGQLDAIVGQGKMTMEDLNRAMTTGILATLQASGVTLSDFGGALATMTDYAIPATQAANSLRMAIYLMSAPTAASNKVLKEFGLTEAEVSSVSKTWTDALERAGVRHAKLADDLRKPGGIILAMQDLRNHMIAAGLSSEAQAEVIYKAFGGGKMGKAVITLYENIAGGARASDAELQKLGFTVEEIATLHDRLITKTAAINAQTNLLGQNFAFIAENDPAFMFKQFLSSVNSLVIVLGQAFIPVLVAIMRWITPIVTQFTAWAIANQPLIRAIGVVGVVFLFAAGAALVFVGILGMIVGAIAAIGAVSIGGTILPMLAILLAVGAAAVGVAFLITTHWKQVQAISGQVMTVIINAIKPLIDSILPALRDAWKQLQPVLGPLMRDLWDVSKPFVVLAAVIYGLVASAAIKALIGFLSSAIPVAIRLVVDSIKLLAAGFKLIADIFRNVAAIVTDIINGNWGKAWEDFKKLLSDVVIDVLNIFGLLVIALVDSVKGLVSIVGGTLGGFVQGIVGYFEWLDGQLGGALSGAFSGIVNRVGKLFSGLGSSINQGLTAAINAVGRFFSMIGTFFRNLLMMGENAWKEFTSRPIYWIGFLIGFWVGALIRLNGIIVGFFKLAVTTAIIHMLMFATSVITALQNLVTQAPIRLGQFKDVVLNYVKSTVEAFIKFWGDGIVAAINWVKWLVGEAPGWWEKLKADAGNWIKSTWDSLVSLFKQGGIDLINTLETLPDSAKSWGIQIVQGLWQGIQDMWGTLKKGLESLVSGLSDGVKKVLGISSPSALFASEVGAPIMQGIWMGIVREQPSVQSGIQTVVKSFSSQNISTVKSSSSDGSMAEVADLLKRWLSQKQTGPTTGVEALIYELNKRVDISRNRGMKAYN